MTRPTFYFKLNRDVQVSSNLVDGSHFSISGQVKHRRHKWLPDWMDEGVMFLSEIYETADGYNKALLELENKAFKSCENLCAQEEKIINMIASHKANLKKLNLGYKLIGWFRGMSGD